MNTTRLTLQIKFLSKRAQCSSKLLNISLSPKTNFFPSSCVLQNFFNGLICGANNRSARFTTIFNKSSCSISSERKYSITKILKKDDDDPRESDRERHKDRENERTKEFESYGYSSGNNNSGNQYYSSYSPYQNNYQKNYSGGGNSSNSPNQYSNVRKKPNWRQRRDKVLRDFFIPASALPAMNERNLKELREHIESHPGAHLSTSTPQIVTNRFDERNQQRMTCTSYCTAEAYDFNKLYLYLAKITSVTLTSPMNSSTVASGVISRPYGENGDASVFYFEGGSMVCWGTSQEDNEKLLQELKPFEIQSIEQVQTETMYFIYGNESSLIESDLLSISSPSSVGDKEVTKHMLAFSYGLHNSVKLAFLEDKVANAIIKMKNIPELLVSYSWSYKRNRQINLQLSEVLKLRAHINLYSELLETPDLFWDAPQLEYYFNLISRNLEISNRIAVVNKRLDYGHELIEVLRTQLTEQHSTSLEWLIIALIAVEVVQGFVHFFW